MIAKIGFVALVLISCGTLYLLDYYLKLDQEENTKQLHNFVQQTRETEKSKVSARERFELDLTTDVAHCHEDALNTYNSYIRLIKKVAPTKNGEPYISKEVLDEAAALLVEEKNECKNIHDTRLREGY